MDRPTDSSDGFKSPSPNSAEKRSSLPTYGVLHPFSHYMTRSLSALPPVPISACDADSSLSSVLISTLTDYLPHSPALTISIGHGHGLLEAYLLKDCPTLNLLGIDVVYKTPQYLPGPQIRILNSTSALSGEARVAAVWMFVYAKDLGLIGRYMQEYGNGEVNTLIWIGPRMDWDDVEKGIPRERWRREVPEPNGLQEYEALVVWRKENTM